MPPYLTKREVRTLCIAQLKKLAKRPDRYGKDKRIIVRIRNIVETLRADSIMAYVPLSIEADVTPLLKEWKRRGKRVYVPFMEGESFGLVQYRYPLKRKRFGVCEPKSAKRIKIKRIDIAIVPVVATDKELGRIGFGKGMYDRFFQKENARIDFTLFVARKTCYVPYKICDEHDVKADIFVTGE
jgi:5-formyltetrahydrofolate cyclo-ligase